MRHPRPAETSRRRPLTVRLTRRSVGALATALLALAGAAPATGASQTSATLVAATLPPPQAGAEVYPRPADGVYEVVGGGYGHGIGMSQYGAEGAAVAGLTSARILAFYYPGTKLVQGGLTTLRVGITVDNDGVLRVRARTGLAVATNGTTSTLPSGRTQWRVRATGTSASSCVVEGYDGSTWSVWHAGTTPCPVAFSSTEGTVDVVLPSGETRVYRGTVSAVHTGSTSLSTVNTVSTQSYLRSVVPAEMPASWKAEALKAQSVAARTYASRRTNGTSWYDTCDTTACQVYRGAGRRNADGTLTSFEYASTDSAVTATNGQVLTFLFSDGVTRLATTMFSSSNGGYAAPGASGHPYLAAHSDAYDAVTGNSRHAWSAELPASSLEARFGIARVERVQILSRDGAGSWGGRVLSVLVEGLTSTGAYTSATTTGNGLMAARPWPTYSTGLSSNYFTLTAATSVGPVSRISGPDRYATAAAVSEAWAPGVAVVYVAAGLNFPDALVSAARAGYNQAPVLLTAKDSVPTATATAMTRLKPERVVVLGGTGVVSDRVAESLRLMTTSGNLQRVAGADRYETAADLAGYYPAGAGVAYVASGADFPDALSGAALAGRDKVPVLLTRPDALPAATAQALGRLAPAAIVVIGGPGAVSDAVAAALSPYATTHSVSRLAGADRYATAAAVAQKFSTASSVYVATGTDFPDALAGAARAGGLGVPLLLTAPASLPAAAAGEITRLSPSRAYVLGGDAVVGTSVMRAIASLIG